MRILIAGVDGYLGWSLAQHLAERGHTLAGIDGFFRRKWVKEMGGESAIPVHSMAARLETFKKHWKTGIKFWQGDLRNYDLVSRAIREFKPEAIVHFGECPSAPYSMIDLDHAVYVQTNNLVSTFNLLFAVRDLVPEAHLVKLGTMGEYGTPPVDIPEGFFEVEFRGRKARMPFPRSAGSWYHWSKVHGSNNIMFACSLWGLRATDIMQGVVFGTRIDAMGENPKLRSRLDFDQAFGTAINRFCTQAVIGHPLTPYGKGLQKRGFIPLRDSMACLTLVLENPPSRGEYRVFNQFQEVYDVTGLAEVVRGAACKLGLDCKIMPVENPRKELEDHYYNPIHDGLANLGYKTQTTVEREVGIMLNDLLPYKDRIEKYKKILIPDVRWDGTHRRSKFANGRTDGKPDERKASELVERR